MSIMSADDEAEVEFRGKENVSLEENRARKKLRTERVDIWLTTLDAWVTKKALYKSHRIGPRRPILYYFRQPIFFRFDTYQLAFYTATKDQIGLCVTNGPMLDEQSRGVGSGLVQMERYVHCQRSKVALRVLKIVEPVKDLIEDYDGHIQRPTEGALIQRSTFTPVANLNTLLLKCAAVLPHNFEDLP
ncbi:hypothetical protein F5887DRAFT_1155265 [Amanita rubescens]|nr:hypothetical protein F5887DRAFT_1155265 [Amanita rubescens]